MRHVSPSLYDETYDNYKTFVNPPLARVMKLSGSPVAVRAHGTTIWDHAGKAYLDFAGGYGVFTLGHTHPRVVAAVREQLDVMALSGKTMFEPLVGRLARANSATPTARCSSRTRCRRASAAAATRSRASATAWCPT